MITTKNQEKRCRGAAEVYIHTAKKSLW